MGSSGWAGGPLPQCFEVDEETWLDEHLYAILEEDWLAASGGASPSGTAGS
jgi:hypothetical protein